MDTQEFVRRPFVVEVIEITAENIAEIAPELGWLRYEDEDPAKPYIKCDPKKLRQVAKVRIGYFYTKMRGPKNGKRCYAPDLFHEQFVALTADLQPWIDHMNYGDAEPEMVEVSPGVEIGQGGVTEVNVFEREQPVPD